MKKFFWIIPFALLTVSCSVEESNAPENNSAERVFARIESVDETATKVFADENLKVLWDADDRISLFKKSTYNKLYRFTGSTGANSGEFIDVNPDAVVTGNPLDNVYSVYPYKAETSISNDGEVISTTLPAEQTYREGSFGIGANTMVSATTNTELVFKNLCGYIVLKLFGEGVSVASITITGKNNEPLAGNVDVIASIGNNPSFAFSGAPTTSITLNCPTPVTLGSTAEQATTFWFAVPPTTFSNGFTITVTDKNGGTFEKSTSSEVVISRNSTYRMKALAVDIIAPQPYNVIYYTTSDGKTIEPQSYRLLSYSNQYTSIRSNEYVGGRGVMTLYGDLKVVGNSAFYGRSTLTSISLPNSVTKIEAGAFHNCTSLSNITLPKSVTTIEGSAFSGCSSLRSIVFPNGITEIGAGTFNDCKSLTTFDIPGSVTTIEVSAFQGCKSLTTIRIPNSVTRVGDNAFLNCSSLQSFYGKFSSDDHRCLIDDNVMISFAPAGLTEYSIPEGVRRIGTFVFWHCENLTSINIPSTVTELGSSSFAYCKGLTEIIIPDSVVSIGDRALAGLTVESITIPDGITIIQSQTFSDCTFTSFTIPESVTTIGSYAFSGTKLKSIRIPGNVSVIGTYAFGNCNKLTSVVIENGVTSIGEQAFSSCSRLGSVVIPESVTSIGKQAFYNCLDLTSITVKPIVPPTGGEQMIVKYQSNTRIYVPSQSVDSYKQAEYWSGLASIIEPIPSSGE